VTLPRDVLLDGGDNVGATFKGHRLLKIWGGQKTFKNRCNLRQLSSLTANISGIDEDSDKI